MAASRWPHISQLSQGSRTGPGAELRMSQQAVGHRKVLCDLAQLIASMFNSRMGELGGAKKSGRGEKLVP